MTTTRKAPATCIDCGRKLTASNRSTTNRDMCEPCFDYAGWENQHEDDAHDDMGNGSVDEAIRAMCPVCQGNAPTAPAPRTGHTNTKPATWSSHAGHDHPATPKARAACRKAAKA
jgi:hypothetical protein